MRLIKFRAWDKELKKFKHPDLWDSSMPSNWRSWYELQQFTGLLDKNGEEIYEGDIVQPDYAHRGEVRFEKCWFYIYPERQVKADSLLSNHISANIEAIGNIYENPELLTKER